MADIIQLLPDSIANQIAAGEVIQRPASVVKELLENAIDAGGTEIKLIIKDSGKTLIQVIDNGKGMSETDARMCFERHATSKIKKSEDLFSIRTKGFRGEALASIAAIAHVEMITKSHENELATRIVIEGSTFKKQEYVQGPTGTNFSVKHLFYNVPARRKFLKSDPVELRHIMDEFTRVALAHPDIYFTFNHNGNEVYHLPKGNLKQRIVNLFGKSINDKLMPVEEETDYVKVEGFIAKIEAAKKNAGEQFLFVNQRFIKSNYLNHAVKLGYDQLLQKDQYPTWFIFLEVDPATIDINVHPTKTEIKFDEERLIYSYIRVAVKHALGKYIMTPTLDFESDSNFVHRHSQASNSSSNEQAKSDSNFRHDANNLERENLKAWENIYTGASQNVPQSTLAAKQMTFESEFENASEKTHGGLFAGTGGRDPYQIHNTYIVSHIKSGFMLIDQQNAHERILYEENLNAIKGSPRPVQKELFSETVEFDSITSALLSELLPRINSMGFEIGEFGRNTFVIHGLPAGLEPGTNPTVLLENLVHQYKENLELQLGVEQNLARSFATSACIKRGQHLSIQEMKSIIDQLFACETPFTSPSGHKCFINYELDELKKKFLKV